jgi:hypothetical protein
MIVLYIGDDPDVAGILPQRVRGKFTPPWALERALSRILLRNPNRIQVEHVVCTFCEPQNCLVPARQSLGAMKAMFKVPNNTIPQLESVLDEYRVKCDV